MSSSTGHDHLIGALRLDLIGPDRRNDSDEPWFQGRAP